MFAVWLTGLPASGKSTIARALAGELEARGVRAVVLESDEMRKVLTPAPTYSEGERDAFYASLVQIAGHLCERSVPVILDATANRRHYRDRGRTALERFLEVHVDAPLEVCRARDPKGLYRSAAASAGSTLPGVGAAYEPPEHPDLVVGRGGESAAAAARRILAALDERGWIPGAGTSFAS